MTPPDTILRAGRFYRAGRWDPSVTAVAVRGGRVVALGADAAIMAGKGSATAVVDLAGGYVLPGLHDAHVHPALGGLELSRCHLGAVRTVAGYQATIGEYAAAHPDRPWILGGGWFIGAFPGGTPTTANLDPVAPDRPVFLPNRDHHSAWVNTEALRRAGIEQSTPDPPDGRIERDSRGRPTGTLHEGAMDLVARFIPPTSSAELEQGLLAGQAHLHSFGLTGWQDALVGTGLGMPDSLPAYCRLASTGRLTGRVVGALWWDRNRGAEQLPDLLARRQRGLDAGFAATSVKIMQDGICETFTAAVLDPYRDAAGHETANRGMSFVDPIDLRGHLAQLDAEGFQVHVHALGDRAVRESLDAVEHARRVNGPRDNRHHLAHLQIVHPDDVARFAPLGVTANAQALWACRDEQLVDLTWPYLGAAARAHHYPFGSLLRAGSRLAAGSDWPVSTPDPFAAMHVAVFRTPPPGDGAPGGGEPLLPDEAITIEAAIDAYTRGSAYVSHLDDTGVIDIGYRADFTVIDTDVVAAGHPDRRGETPGGALADTRVTLTIVGGEVVYAA